MERVLRSDSSSDWASAPSQSPSLTAPKRSRTLHNMKPFNEAEPFRLKDHLVTSAPFKDADTEAAERALLEALDELPVGSLLTVDFTGVRISSEAARRLLRRALLRITGGELADRYLVLGDLGDSLYNVEVMLEGESLVVVERSDDEGAILRGDVDQAIRDTYAFVRSVPEATASLVQAHFKLSNISTATNRLTNLSKLAIARRVEQRPVAGGGREFVYAAVQ